MHAAPRRPARGNWIWLVSGLLSLSVLTGVALSYSSGGCPATTAAHLDATVQPSQSPSASRSPAARQVTSGVALYYNTGTSVGGCSLGPFPSWGRYVALPPSRYAHGAACGTYLEVRGPKGEVRAEVVDLCSGCGYRHINLSRAAFDQIGDSGTGWARVRFWPLANPRLRGPIILRTSTTASGRLTIQVLRHGNQLASVAVARPGTSTPDWHWFVLNTDDYWVARTHLGDGQFNVRIKDDQGHLVVIPRLPLVPGRTIHTRTWMYHGSGPASGTAMRAASPAPSPAANRGPSPVSTGCASSQ
jgi:expansin (peptidoglycan-binding protein)